MAGTAPVFLMLTHEQSTIAASSKGNYGFWTNQKQVSRYPTEFIRSFHQLVDGTKLVVSCKVQNTVPQCLDGEYEHLGKY